MVQILVILLVGIFLVPFHCRANNVNRNDKRLIKTSKHHFGTWMTEKEIFGLIKNRRRFVDATDFIHEPLAHDPVDNGQLFTIPSSTRYHSDVLELSRNISISRVVKFIKYFASYHNRYFRSETGRSSQLWLLSQVKELVENYPGGSVKEVDHSEPQKSIVARLPGTDPSLAKEIVVLGAHLDSLNRDEREKPAPGADDNASGTGAVLETLRVIVMSKLNFKRTLEFHWYAAEEVGYRGSTSIVSSYYRKKVNVVGMLNVDMVGHYVEGVNKISIKTDYTDNELTKFLEMLANEYLDFVFTNNECGYGCSDHGSWNEYGYRAVFAGETNNSLIHTDGDTIDTLNFVKVREFIKLAVAFMVEMAELSRL